MAGGPAPLATLLLTTMVIAPLASAIQIHCRRAIRRFPRWIHGSTLPSRRRRLLADLSVPSCPVPSGFMSFPGGFALIAVAASKSTPLVISQTSEEYEYSTPQRG